MSCKDINISTFRVMHDARLVGKRLRVFEIILKVSTSFQQEENRRRLTYVGVTHPRVITLLRLVEVLVGGFRCC